MKKIKIKMDLIHGSTNIYMDPICLGLFSYGLPNSEFNWRPIYHAWFLTSLKTYVDIYTLFTLLKLLIVEFKSKIQVIEDNESY